MSDIKVLVEIVGKRIGLKSSTRFPGDVDMCKMIPGHSWNKSESMWTYPISVGTCLMLRFVFSTMLEIGPTLSVWAKESFAKAEAQRALGKRKDAELDQLNETHPWLSAAMEARPYQRVGTAFLAAGRPGAAIWDTPGLGKTLQSLASLAQTEDEGLFGAHLIAAPITSLKPVWLREIKQWLQTDEVFVHTGGHAARSKEIDRFWCRDVDTKFLIVNPEMLAIKMGHWCEVCEGWDEDGLPVEHHINKHSLKRVKREVKYPDLFEIPWRTVIADEAHKYLLGIRGANRKTQMGWGFTSLTYDESPLRIASTGTPFRGRISNVWGMLHWLRPEEYPSYWHWAETYLAVTSNGFGQEVGGLRPGWEQKFYDDIDRLAIRRVKHEVQADLPKAQVHNVFVEMNAQQMKQYKAMQNAGEAALADMESSGQQISAIGVLAELTRLKQFAFGEWEVDTERKNAMRPKSSPKFDWFVDFLDERGITGDPETEYFPESKEDGHKIVFASNSTQAVRWICKQLNDKGIKTLKITGDESEQQRSAAEQEFQSYDGARVIGLNTIAGGSAITLDAYCDEGVIFDETWVPDDQEQVMGRIDNRNPEMRIHPVDWYYVRSSRTIDEEIANKVITKETVQKTVLDIRRGVDVTLQEIIKHDD